jgi:hypothetical protein
MKNRKLATLSVDQLVQLFSELSVQQDAAPLSNAQREVNRFFGKSTRWWKSLNPAPEINGARCWRCTSIEICRFG